MKLADLQNDQVVTLRLGRYVGGDAIEPAWGPWHQEPIYVARRTEPLPKSMLRRRYVRSPNVGDILTLVPKDTPWAEYGQEDYHPDTNTWCVEDYYMQIEGLTP